MKIVKQLFKAETWQAKPRTDGSVDQSTQSEPVFCVIDVETTGLDPTRDEICEVAFVLLDANAKPLGEGVSFVRPSANIGAAATRIHGITKQTVERSPRLPEVLLKLQSPLDPRLIIVAHNLDFDLAFLSNSSLFAARHPNGICTLQMAREVLPQANEWGLDYLANRLRLDSWGERSAHHALNDARATAALFQMMLRKLPGKQRTLEALIERFGRLNRPLEISEYFATNLAPRVLRAVELGHRPLDGQRVVVTGTFDDFMRADVLWA